MFIAKSGIEDEIGCFETGGLQKTIFAAHAPIAV